jgi:hypothetical protein
MAKKKTTSKKAPASKAAKIVPAPQRPTKTKVAKTKVAKTEAAAPKAENVEAKPAKTKAAKPAKEKKLSCIDAAAQILAASKTPMNTNEMIEAIGAQGLWSSPSGKTPSATLYSSIIREIATKGKDARFTKTKRGKFAAN